MSYDIRLKDPETGETLLSETRHMLQGGTHAVGGTRELWLNVTYNYSSHFSKVLGSEGIRVLYGQRAADTLALLAEAASKLGEEVHEDYWQPTEGNARLALLDLLRLALMAPDGVWDGD